MKSARMKFGCALVMVLAAECCAAAIPPLNLPFYPQKKNGCGAASVSMVMYYWEDHRPGTLTGNLSPQDVYESLYRPEQKGIQLADMKRYLEGRGLRVFTLRGQWADVEEHLAKGRPIIAGLKAGRTKPVHFVVVTGTGSGFVWLNDPTRKEPSRLERAKFERRWALADRWMLLAAPPSHE
jgi:ABC-type bacteriocin/lantibiotic exporter with double-glycine peptidase domain